MRLWTIAAPLIGAMALTACSSGETESTPNTAEATPTVAATSAAPAISPVETASALPAESASSTIPIKKAIRIAKRTVPGAAVEGSDDDDNGTQIWNIVIRQNDATGTEVDIDAATGAVIGQSPEGLSPVQKQPLPDITATQAIKRAQKQAGGASAVEFDLETWKGQVVWHVVTQDASTGEFEFEIDASTGAVLNQQRD